MAVFSIGLGGSRILLDWNEDHSNVSTKWLLNFKNVITHSTVMLRAVNWKSMA